MRLPSFKRRTDLEPGAQLAVGLGFDLRDEDVVAFVVVAFAIAGLVSMAAVAARPYDGVLSANFLFLVDASERGRVVMASAWESIKSESAHVANWASSVVLTRLPARISSTPAAAPIVDATAYEVVEHTSR